MTTVQDLGFMTLGTWLSDYSSHLEQLLSKRIMNCWHSCFARYVVCSIYIVFMTGDQYNFRRLISLKEQGSHSWFFFLFFAQCSVFKDTVSDFISPPTVQMWKRLSWVISLFFIWGEKKSLVRHKSLIPWLKALGYHRTGWGCLVSRIFLIALQNCCHWLSCGMNDSFCRLLIYKTHGRHYRHLWGQTHCHHFVFIYLFFIVNLGSTEFSCVID